MSGIFFDLADLGERADLDAVRRFLDAVHLGDAGEIDHDLGPLDAVLEPGQRVVAAGEFPDVGFVLVEQCDCIGDGGGPVEFEARNDIFDHHGRAPGYIVFACSGL